MRKRFIHYIKGCLLIKVCGYSPERFLNLCRNKQILIWGLLPCGDCYQMYISIKGFKKLKPILKKTGTHVSIIKKIGLPFYIYKYRKRKAFIFGGFLCAAILYGLSMFVWGIQIDGNLKITDETILEYLQTQNVKYGMLKSNVDCERIVKDIRKNYEDIVWVSVSTKGSFLRIHIKENTDSVKMVQETTTPSDLYAKKKGKIIEIITRVGVPKVKAGDMVKKGQLLVSGQVEIKNDSGEVTEIQYQHSDADIIAETNYKYYEELPLNYQKKTYTGKKRCLFLLRHNKYIFSCGIESNKFEHSDTYISNYQWDFPIHLSKKVINEYKYSPATYSKEDANRLLSLQFEQYINELEEQGRMIQSYDVKVYFDKEKAYAKGNVVVWEDIGKQAVINIDF